MKTFKQFNEGLGSIRIVPALVKTGLAGLGLYGVKKGAEKLGTCLLYTSPSPRD